MSMPDYRRNHYVPKWYQNLFFASECSERKFWYMDLHPEIINSGKHVYRRSSLLPWGPSKCFCERDLYTTEFGDWQSTEIEQKFFGRVDAFGNNAIRYFADFKHPSANGKALDDLVSYMSIQKLRTPKGLSQLSKMTKSSDKNAVLLSLQKLRNMYCAL